MVITNSGGIIEGGVYKTNIKGKKSSRVIVRKGYEVVAILSCHRLLLFALCAYVEETTDETEHYCF